MAIDDIVTDPNLSAVLAASRETRLQALALVDHLAAVGSLDSASKDVQSEASKRQKLLITNLAQLRGLHRAAQFGARQTKTQTSEARHEVDTLHLQLQNLYYEQRHLQGEIAACESYDHTYQQLPLIPVEEFLALQPEHADDDENTLMVARIEHERADREALEQQRMELLKRKQKLIADNKKRKDDLANLDKELEKFIDAAKPIQSLFDKNVAPSV
ncbi:Fms-interacting protein-domain-containing protein [Microdochium trichocladiopsis]|uniref:Fms-interacting protein-domain-containing protein n=1 Tax=Microdochium trichocladiopsis TaxID=1682393 RepID=A0A9P8YDX0_9PEZI|nr:Fms-interacting protein-domain-containing protein [Microdochium trichocladiopsis]KAH7035171.1 Fms-interacting protein-domain-containing protein [Microdochium trichocladiopsis]